MSGSILNDVKKILGVEPDYTAFDLDILTHINTVFATLNQLGIGPVNGFAIEDDTAEWIDFMGDNPLLNTVKTYVYLRVRLIFDPMPTAHANDSMERQLREFEWRLSVLREGTSWVDPDPDDLPDDENIVLDGGEP